MSAFLIAFGRISDTYGRRRILLIGLALFIAGSVISATAPSAVAVIAGMGISGVGFAAMLPGSLSIVLNAYPPGKRGLPVGIWGAATVFFQALGPLLGGALTFLLDWPWIFWFDAAVAAAIVATVLWATAESKDPQAERRIDSTGLALAAGALITFTLAVIQGPAWGFGAPQTLVLFAVSIVLAALFLLAERRAPAPLVNFSFFRHLNFTGATIVLFVVNFALIVALFFLPLLFQELLDYSTMQAGLLLLPLLGAMLVVLPAGGPIAQRIGPLPPIALGMASTAIGFLLLAGVDRQSTYAELWLPMALVGFGVGISLTPMNIAAMNAIHTRESGAAGGLFMTLAGIGIGFGVAITGAVFNARQLSETQTLADDRGIEVSKATAQNLDGLLAGASGAKDTLKEFSKSNQDALENVVREAFVLGLESAFRVGALVALVGLVLAALLIRRRPPADEVEAAEVRGATGAEAAPTTVT